MRYTTKLTISRNTQHISLAPESKDFCSNCTTSLSRTENYHIHSIFRLSSDFA